MSSDDFDISDLKKGAIIDLDDEEDAVVPPDGESDDITGTDEEEDSNFSFYDDGIRDGEYSY